MRDAETTFLLRCFSEGDASVTDELLRRIYDSLAMRAHHLAKGTDLPIVETGVLVNELYLRLDRLASHEFRDRTHFLAVAAACMRNICCDFARAETARSRRQRATAQAERQPLSTADERMLGVEQAIADLEQLHQRQARVVEMKFFADMGLQQISDALNVSVETVKKDWQMAKAFLVTRLEGGMR
jgi:RNA polymerase sigma factor (TIGR02999 family)